ncbi:hypothetical protein LTR37_016410 [Vermiconidia calcicola]|uniref:Uncharacterized protein n=1 Tax=Vermiconidia calcicola TaxID=1690605 RepID=A0ACC3MN06_9PEZI|nr:hypothetical protein LTR37_016410 [Vermiconidia calcicola]
MDWVKDKMNSTAGGGKDSEKNEDYLDKGTHIHLPYQLPARLTCYTAGIDYVQENFMGQGKQDNEDAVEQAKDEQISDFIRGQYKSKTGSDMPIEDKATTLDSSKD